MKTSAITQFFSQEAGPGGNLSKTEFNDALKQAGAGQSFNAQEFMKLGSSLGLSARDSQAVFNYLEHNGHVSVAALRDKMMSYAGKDQAFNLSEFKSGIDHLVHRSERGQNQKINLFRQADGGKLDYQAFKALANKAGITDPNEIKKVFNEIAGPDGKISKDAMQAAFGSTKMSLADFKQKFDQIASGQDPSANPPQPTPGEPQQPDPSGSTQPDPCGSTQPNSCGSRQANQSGWTDPNSSGSTESKGPHHHGHPHRHQWA